MSIARLAALAWALLSAPGIAGQDPGAEKPAPDSWKVLVDLGVDASGGNRSLTIIRGGFGITYLRTDRAEFDLQGAMRYGEDEGSVIERQFRGSLKFDLNPADTWSPFLFASAFRDPIRRKLAFRSEGGGGVKYTFLTRPTGKASLSLAAIWSSEHFTEEPDGNRPKERDEARWSWRSKINKQFGAAVSLEQVTFFQPVWDQWSDHIVVAQTSLQSRVAGRVSVVIRHEYLHDETPAEGVMRDDWNLTVGFRLDL
jgi:hypothetical protein